MDAGKSGIDFDGVGRLWIEDGRLRFEGNTSKAARILFDAHVKPMADAYIATRLSGAPGFVPGGKERAVKEPGEKREPKTA